jgi:hypothetical protein
MNWLWAYFRRKTAESILAGVHDALVSENGASGLSDDQAARALRALVAGGHPTSDPGAAAETPQLAGPQPNGGAAQTEPQRRGPGRPRKFQEPPA